MATELISAALRAAKYIVTGGGKRSASPRATKAKAERPVKAASAPRARGGGRPPKAIKAPKPAKMGKQYGPRFSESKAGKGPAMGRQFGPKFSPTKAGKGPAVYGPKQQKVRAPKAAPPAKTKRRGGAAGKKSGSGSGS